MDSIILRERASPRNHPLEPIMRPCRRTWLLRARVTQLRHLKNWQEGNPRPITPLLSQPKEYRQFVSCYSRRFLRPPTCLTSQLPLHCQWRFNKVIRNNLRVRAQVRRMRPQRVEIPQTLRRVQIPTEA